jgi:RNA polymerase sigma-70 factor, ECF subfamily
VGDYLFVSDDPDLEALFRARQREVFVYFLQTTGDALLAEELAQETFVRAFGAVARFRGDSSLRTWVFAIARNVLHKHRERAARERRVPVAGPEAEERDDAARLSVQAALASLRPADRETLVLCDVLQFTPSEAAAVLGVEPGAMRVRLHRARARFREVYAHA